MWLLGILTHVLIIPSELFPQHTTLPFRKFKLKKGVFKLPKLSLNSHCNQTGLELLFFLALGLKFCIIRLGYMILAPPPKDAYLWL